MKKYLAFLLIFACFIMLVSCDAVIGSTDTYAHTDTATDTVTDTDIENTDTEEHPYFFCKVVEVYDKTCLAEVTDKGNCNFAAGERLILHTNIDGAPECSEGDGLKVVFDGKVALSYPGQITCIFAIYKTDTN